MFLESFKTEGVAHLSYLIGNNGEACVIDPQLDIERYLSFANNNDCKITTIIETHRNEDFISGALALSEETGATVYHGPNPDKEIEYAKTTREGDTYEIGSWKLKVIETPGHTKDSICISLFDTNSSESPVGVFTGDTLFVSDVGRTDFYPDEMEEMASALFDSLQKLKELGDHVNIYPGHGAGSVCGGGMADREFSTIGVEKRSNPMFSMDSKQSFVEKKINENHYIAPYFEQVEEANVKGHRHSVKSQECQPLTSQDEDNYLASPSDNVFLIDVRSHKAFRNNHVPGSTNLPGGLISAYGGWFLSKDHTIVIISEGFEQANSAHKQLLRMGYKNIAGYTTNIPFPLTEQEKRKSSIESVSAEEVKTKLDAKKKDWILLDVRKRDEVEEAPFAEAMHIYLGHLKDKKEEINPSLHYTCMCGSGKRATVAASYLKAMGCSKVDVFIGSLKAWKEYTKN